MIMILKIADYIYIVNEIEKYPFTLLYAGCYFNAIIQLMILYYIMMTTQ